MKPAQYTGKTDATPGEQPPGDRAHSATVPSPAPSSVSAPAVGARAKPAKRVRGGHGGDMMRFALWGSVFAILVAGLVLYFRYERAILPLFGRGR